MEPTVSVSDVAIFFPDAIDVLNRFNLDYYCNGTQSFLQACAQQNLDPSKVWEEILNTSADFTSGRTYEAWEPSFLGELIFRHYNDLETKVPLIKECLDNVWSRCIADDRDQVSQIRSCFDLLTDALKQHMTSEEFLLQPLCLQTTGDHRTQVPSSENVKISRDSICKLETDHKHIGSLLYNLRQCTAHYNMDGFSSPFVQLAGILLHQFDKDLTQRLHLENNILFPKLRT